MSLFSSLSEGIAILDTSSSYVSPSKATSKEIHDLVSTWILAQKKSAQARHNIWSCILPGVDNTLRHRIILAQKHPDFNETDFDESLKYVLPPNQIPVFFHVRDKAASIYQNMGNPARKRAEAPAQVAAESTAGAAKSAGKNVASLDGKQKPKQGKPKVGTSVFEPTETSTQPMKKAKFAVTKKRSDDADEPRRSVRKRNAEATAKVTNKTQKLSRVSLVVNNQEEPLPSWPLVASSKGLMNTTVRGAQSASGTSTRSAQIRAAAKPKKKNSAETIKDNLPVSTRTGGQKTKTKQRGADVEKTKTRANSSPLRKIAHRMSTPKQTIQKSSSGKTSLAVSISLAMKKDALRKKRSSWKQTTAPAQEQPLEGSTKKQASCQTPLAGTSKRATKLAAKVTPPPAHTSTKKSSARTKGSPSKQKIAIPPVRFLAPRTAKVAAPVLASRPVASQKLEKVAGATKKLAVKTGKAASKSAKGVAKSAPKGITKRKGAANESVKKPRKGATPLSTSTIKHDAPSGQGKRKRSQMTAVATISDQSAPGRDLTVNSDSDTEVLTKAPSSTIRERNVVGEAAAQPGNSVTLWQRFIQSFTIASTSTRPFQIESPTPASSGGAEGSHSQKRRRVEEEVKDKLRPSRTATISAASLSSPVSPDTTTLVHRSTLLQRIERNLGIANHTLTEQQVETPGVDFSKYREMLERHARRLTETFEHLKLRLQREWDAILIQTEAEQKTKWPALLENQKNRWVDFKDDIRSLMGRCARDFHQQVVSGQNQLTVPERRFYTAARQSLKWRQERLEDTVGRMDREAKDFFELDRDLQFVEWVEFLGLLQRRFKVLESSEEALLTTHLEDCVGILHSE